jgi:asparagine synthase (glutamine-hydrolysing)
MCGIAGFVRLDGAPASRELLKAMTDRIAHRGPDGEGQWVEGPVGLGHRRLAIIDTSATGAQPMHSGDGRYILSYNGEVYNFRELRSELERAGHRFRSDGDTEVVLVALAKWGVGALDRFNGMFAFAFYDRTERRLLLARDRYGIKPLYHTCQGGVVAFASEQKAITVMPEVREDLDLEALLEYFTFQNIFTDRTLVKDMRLFPAGHYAELDLTDRAPRLRLTRYWDYRFCEPEQSASREEYVEELDRLFRQAVERQLVSDVEIGAYLSGGMDSGSITAIAAARNPDLKSFTVGFDLSSASGLELAFDERETAEAMSALYRTEHYEIVLKAGDMERCLPQLAWHLEEPRVGQSYPNFYASKLASRFVKVVLSGTGGDELFGGYPWRYYRAANSRSFEEYIDEYYLYWQRLLSNREIKQLFAPVWSEVAHVWTRDIFRDVFASHDNTLDRPEDYINHSLYFEAKTFLHGLFVVEDKLSMAHSLESRVPFMDNDLVDFAMQCPVSLKVHNLAETLRLDENLPGGKRAAYTLKTNDGKHLLRGAMSRHVPEPIADAKKQGFSGPDASWFRGSSVSFVSKVSESAPRILAGALNWQVIRDAVAQHAAGGKNRRLLLWSVLYLSTMLDASSGTNNSNSP